MSSSAGDTKPIARATPSPEVSRSSHARDRLSSPTALTSASW